MTFHPLLNIAIDSYEEGVHANFGQNYFHLSFIHLIMWSSLSSIFCFHSGVGLWVYWNACVCATVSIIGGWGGCVYVVCVHVLCVCMYCCVHVLCVCVHVLCVSMSLCMCVCVCVYVHVCTCAHVCVCMCVCVYACVCSYFCECVHACMYLCVVGCVCSCAGRQHLQPDLHRLCGWSPKARWRLPALGSASPGQDHLWQNVCGGRRNCPPGSQLLWTPQTDSECNYCCLSQNPLCLVLHDLCVGYFSLDRIKKNQKIEGGLLFSYSGKGLHSFASVETVVSLSLIFKRVFSPPV